jgi:hypothetical protein
MRYNFKIIFGLYQRKFSQAGGRERNLDFKGLKSDVLKKNNF